MSSYINHFKKTAEQNAKDLQDIPSNWEEMQTADIDEMEQVKLEQIKQDNREPIEEEARKGNTVSVEPTPYKISNTLLIWWGIFLPSQVRAK